MPKPSNPPVAPGVYKFDSETTMTRDNKGGMGWMGSFPSTPCVKCRGEYFRWVGDWNLGFYCIECRRVWMEAHAQPTSLA